VQSCPENYALLFRKSKKVLTFYIATIMDWILPVRLTTAPLFEWSSHHLRSSC